MRYRAFFSYSRADDRIANWLHGQLDSYRTPKGLVGTQGALGRIPAKLHPIFRDRTDLASGAHLDADLQAALENSETLVVLCSPDAAKSTWVNHEIETFIRLGRKDRIFPVIARGEPNSGDPGTECFPPALRPQGILAADLRQFKTTTGQLVGDGREAARLKLIAGLLGLPLDELAKRERRRQRQVSAALGGERFCSRPWLRSPSGRPTRQTRSESRRETLFIGPTRRGLGTSFVTVICTAPPATPWRGTDYPLQMPRSSEPSSARSSN